MEIIKQYRDGNERHDIVCLAGETLFENWYSVLEDSCCLRHPSSEEKAGGVACRPAGR